VAGVYETMPVPGYDYQSWMLAEVRALDKAVAAKVSAPPPRGATGSTAAAGSADPALAAATQCGAGGEPSAATCPGAGDWDLLPRERELA